jgi:hypothetical protein
VKIVFGGAFALIALGIALFFLGAAIPWVVFCVSLGVGLILITSAKGNTIVLGIGIALLVVAGIAFAIALIENDRQLPRLQQ